MKFQNFKLLIAFLTIFSNNMISASQGQLSPIALAIYTTFIAQILTPKNSSDDTKPESIVIDQPQPKKLLSKLPKNPKANNKVLFKRPKNNFNKVRGSR